ncbi:Fatty acid synthase subunit beta Includes: 3-hydroxypalmitoyl-[acyl-carrier-protein] dehydratase; Enoyl-[acyl-carrier-protein] reductase [NADH]; [Acyl-carrier-protein] acetyltransferase; [Acyl-carrier-protein] malonyltransferase; S-acyl fatty acid synthas [Scheffersomyces stipitis CBS 6054]|uniref:Fatty acid synthase subunit beta n=1 Tax=Scheffersomyces stipitis (strain ATCC 58785 / CBS 6054 / NBRC 10063 / NRRL Y-11545) TaxID=322104 RepID=A3LZH0_PICST|nr:Fatty acid synthase subunit beta Includes: 3-hydroxypalmitoyl-[acyl-carrier-protein] dehydratase; Enoyl-[acyl-carrier-protein] reductase [NADH]; [Acyl-carrier-protein] acetyltransferase; [Acyl-carrier-protein] malonyltransferase; S-acyl fatty acid synthas [Scheffersomyces stipitis CBS 6054]ABN68335.2 Fatty acid synthase subunit beta Includes: 3-hydroxypalmitoyl-[acyl-carrier-protein] dehydratase; Enoyl-[acyl-carrier-protein] reductase [NADH]; [Acyl-carrier-protein] acetyltransferase; [Acyl-carr
MPSTTSFHRPFSLNHGSIEHTLLVPNDLFFNYSQLKDSFIKTLPEVTEGFADDNEPSSPAELYGKFLGFIASLVTPNQPGQFDQVLKLSLQDFTSRFLKSHNDNIHAFAVTLLADDVNYPTTPAKIKDNIIKNYYNAVINSNTKIDKVVSNLLYQAEAGDAKLVAIFGGQGNTDDYFEELRDLYKLYKGLIHDDLIEPFAAKLAKLVKQDSAFDKIYTQGLNILSWLSNPEQTPDQDYLLSVPVSCPVICIIQLCHYAITCKVLGLTPGELRSYLNAGTTGHSQGLVTAVAIASSDSWDSYFENSLKAISLLFFIGSRCLMSYPRTTLPPTMLQDSLENGEGRPSPMLSIRDLSASQVEKFIDETNKHLPQEKHITLSLINGARNLVVSGPPESLYGLNLTLRNKKAPNGLDQSRIPHSQRKLKFSNRFLPIFSPFHSPLLDNATIAILEDVEAENLNFPKKDIKIPVYDTFNGENFQDYDESSTSIIERVVRCITQLRVNWELATAVQATHMLDFGPGGVSGVGILTHRNKEGTGSRFIIAGSLEASAFDDEYGFKHEIFHTSPSKNVKRAQNWLTEFKPTLIKNNSGKIFVNTKFSQLLGRAPLMVPGMTPTTVNPEIIAASINAGYHIELAGGGYFHGPGMEAAIDEVVSNIKPGFSFGINLIYVNPRMLQWGIPLIKELRERGYPIQSLTIGAGVPSLEVCTEYIEELGLTHLGLKPGSIDAISQVISIAKAHPNFPIVLQWTGGRGGGHHSFEDFHQPILQMYSKIRRCSNIVLVAGSGFGSDEDTYPYLTGSWAAEFNYPAMPFDGVLFGSRVMTSKEAHTSLEAKKLIAQCDGVADSHWENTYKKPSGGIITVRSEMGEPIHKIATRGVMFWKELDDTIFNLPKNKLLEALNKKKDYIIDKLNKDFQKPWFGKNSQGVCDLQDMTYQEVANRMIELLYVKKSDRWVDISLRNFFGDFLRRTEERFTSSSGSISLIQNYNQLATKPQQFSDDFFNHFPVAKDQLISEEDCDFFLMCALRPTQKPSPFVPVLDERFELFFKKDSLWQSEDLETVVDEDVQRTCILHGPVAAQFTNKVNEPIGEILDSIHEGHISKLVKDYYNGDATKIPVVEYFGNTAPVKFESLANVDINRSSDKIVYKIGATLPAKKCWLKLLAGEQINWLQAFISTDRIVQGSKHISNSVHDILTPAANSVVEISHPLDATKTTLTVSEPVKGDLKPVVEIKLAKANTIQLSLIEHRTADSKPVALPFLYTYNPNDGFAPILEVMENRNDRIKNFYWKLWFGADVPYDLNINVQEEIIGEEITITGQDISEFTHAIGNKCDAFVTRPGKVTLAPMDFAIVIGWRAIIKAIFPESVDGDLLKLVHLSNGYKMIPGAAPLKKDDVVSSKAEIRAVLNQPSGKMVEVVGTIYREGKPVLEVTSQFLYRGDYSDYENTFQKVTETPVQIAFKSPKDLAILKSKEWFHLEKDVELLDQTLTFRCKSTYKFKSAQVYSSIITTGQVYLELPTKEVIQVGTIEYEAAKSYGNPVTDYFARNGKTIEEAVKFENVIPLSSGEELTSKAPGTNEPYAIVSGDYNPIHVSRVFAAYAKLPGTITHGMYSSASIRGLVEEWAANNVASRVRAFSCSFVGMVLPNDTLQTTLEHVGMINGRKIIKVETKNVETDIPVLVGEAEIDQPITTYVFTGQGSQEQGMGMDLYKSSEVAREVWDKADRHFVNNYGFSILDIVQNNPNELTIHFGGAKGRKIRDNYIGMMFETIGEDGAIKSEKIFKDIDHTTTSFTFVSPTGLLSATQFTQPALTLMEKAAYEDIKSKGLIPSDIMFAGHSLGEYSALSSLANVMPIESLVDVVFYRGMTMQVAVPRDELGRSNYGMCAVNPSRVSPTFDDAALRFVVDEVSDKTKWLLEIVNYNVENQQYVTAGDLRALDTLTNVLNVIKLNKIDIVKLQQTLTLDQVKEHLSEIITEVSAQSIAKPQPIDLQRGFAVIPLKGISVPFHSSYLMSGVKPFQRFLCKKIPKSSVKPNDLIGKYIPNLTAKPFEITKEYFQEVYELTKSDKIKSILENWDSYEKA